MHNWRQRAWRGVTAKTCELNIFKSGKKNCFLSAPHPVVTCLMYRRGEELSRGVHTSDGPALSGGTEKLHHKPFEVLATVSATEPLSTRVNASLQNAKTLVTEDIKR